MEAKVQDMIEMKDEREFFTLIERKMKKEGFEVLETLPLAPADLKAVLQVGARG